LYKNLVLIIPALNESKTIKDVIAGASEYGQVIVVDDGSNDETACIAKNAGAIVIRHSSNQGYDRALASGLQKAIDIGYQFAITLDADGQHRSDAIQKVFTRLHDGAELVVGRRDRHQRIAEVLFAWISHLVWHIADPLCGIKGYNLDRLRTVTPLWTYNSVGTELTLLGVRSGWRVDQVSVHTNLRPGPSRFGGGIKANWIIFRALVVGLLNRRRAIH